MGDDPDERRETIALVTDELDRMTRFVDDLLLLAKAERHDFLRAGDASTSTRSPTSCSQGRRARAADWRLDGRGDGRLVADRQRLTQAVMNLAHNAVQHTAPTTRSGRLRARDGEARLWVPDRGPGVAPEDQARIFERFARAPAAGAPLRGRGLGLAIVRAIADAHGGRVECRQPPRRAAPRSPSHPADEHRGGHAR